MLWPFEYYAPTCADEVSGILADKENVAILAGGTNLIIDMEQGVTRPDHLVDVKKVDKALAFDVRPGSDSYIGAAVPVNALGDCENKTWSCVNEAVLMMATHQVRNRATLAGNLCNASPAADLAPPFLVLGSNVEILSAGASRKVPLEKFFTGVKSTCLEKGEWVVGLTVDPHSKSTRSAFMKKQRVRGHDLAIINVAGLCDPDSGVFRISIGACSVTPLLFNFDQEYSDSPSKELFIENALKKVAGTIKPISDVRAGAAYRRDMVEYFTGLVLDKIYV